MKKLALILLPLQVCPGDSSINTLLLHLASENEKYKKLNMTIFSKYSDKAEEESKNYPNTNFVYIKLTKLDEKLIFMYRVIKKIFKIKVPFLDRYYYKCYKVCKEKNFDKIIVEAGAYDSYEQYAKKFGRDKMILHLHQGDYKKRHEKIFSRVICVSEFLKKWMEEKFGNKVKCDVLKNASDLQNFKQDILEEEKQRLRKSLNISEKDFVIIFCGRLFEDKGILELVRSFKALPSHMKLLIIGAFNNSADNEFMNKFKEEVNQVSEKIRVVGPIKYSEINLYYSIADLQVIPSKWEEPAGLVAIEGMVSGVPIIATRSGGMIEYIDDECARIIEKDTDLEKNIANAILTLYQDRDKCERMSEHGKQRAELFSKQKYYEDFVELVNSWE